jgi:hypothetical protein
MRWRIHSVPCKCVFLFYLYSEWYQVFFVISIELISTQFLWLYGPHEGDWLFICFYVVSKFFAFGMILLCSNLQKLVPGGFYSNELDKARTQNFHFINVLKVAQR